MKDWTPSRRYGGHAFGFANFATKLSRRDDILPWIAEYSSYALVSKEDPPVYMIYSGRPAIGHEQKDPTHMANFGVKLHERCNEVGVACELVYPGARNVASESATEFPIAMLNAP